MHGALFRNQVKNHGEPHIQAPEQPFQSAMELMLEHVPKLTRLSKRELEDHLREQLQETQTTLKTHQQLLLIQELVLLNKMSHGVIHIQLQVQPSQFATVLMLEHALKPLKSLSIELEDHLRELPQEIQTTSTMHHHQWKLLPVTSDQKIQLLELLNKHLSKCHGELRMQELEMP